MNLICSPQDLHVGATLGISLKHPHLVQQVAEHDRSRVHRSRSAYTKDTRHHRHGQSTRPNLRIRIVGMDLSIDHLIASPRSDNSCLIASKVEPILTP